jgi:hypothetical protein
VAQPSKQRIHAWQCVLTCCRSRHQVGGKLTCAAHGALGCTGAAACWRRLLLLQQLVQPDLCDLHLLACCVDQLLVGRVGHPVARRATPGVRGVMVL